MVVGETGWPTAGHADATVSNAATYINNAAQMGIDGLIDMFLFEAFHEPSKTAIPGSLQDNPEEKNFGLLEHSGTPKMSRRLRAHGCQLLSHPQAPVHFRLQVRPQPQPHPHSLPLIVHLHLVSRTAALVAAHCIRMGAIRILGLTSDITAIMAAIVANACTPGCRTHCPT